MNKPPDVDYLHARLMLTESGRGEVRELLVEPFFDEPRVELSILDNGDEYEEVCVVVNRSQIECLVDFLTAWLVRDHARRATTAPAASTPPSTARSEATPPSAA
jgi:hypothetical protein